MEIEQKHIAEFLAVMKVDVDGSRSESGCLRFDLLHDKETSNKFVFYESYDAHNESPGWNCIYKKKTACSSFCLLAATDSHYE